MPLDRSLPLPLPMLPLPLLLLLPLPPLLLCVPASPVFEGSETMPLQGVYGEYTPRSGAPQQLPSRSPCAWQCVTFRAAGVHCDDAPRLVRVRRYPPASRDRPARVGHAAPPLQQRN